MAKEFVQMTTTTGRPVYDNQNVMSVGPRGPLLLQDVWYLEKLAAFDRERIPERVVHAHGSGAHGVFEATADISKYSKAKVFVKGTKTPMFIRFSTVAPEKGSADAVRDPRGFAVKFYTQEGNWDLVGNNTPIFFIRDPLKFPDFIHSQKRDPKKGVQDPEMWWDFWCQTPESLHQVTYLMGDRGIPATYRHMNGYGSHTFSLINAKNQRFWVKFHFHTLQGIKNLTNEEAAAVRAKDMDSHQRDLYESIERRDYPKWRVSIQVMPESDAKTYRFHPFDVTKIWSHKDYPLIEIGIMTLNRNPENYFAEVEQSALNPANIVPGIGFSPDRLLQGRLFSYGDTQRYRLGVNHHQLPINASKVAINNTVRDGFMTNGSYGSMRNYNPSVLPGYKDSWNLKEPILDPSTFEKETRLAKWDYREEDNDYYTQPGDLYRLMKPDEKERLCQTIAGTMKGIDSRIIKIQLEHFRKADPAYGKRVADLLK
ncbi:catalase [Helicobacter muridarum]|uniref:Catalase n=1 Tax=Helicobacter muridarum TaxID=216 RepID=A0A099TYR4_9HELI|nr:catalase [Helicobacter muridarum]TLE01652.1 catalase [Helicobacter muridarum]STQ86276.1 catalase [Helicobacter muridarum]